MPRSQRHLRYYRGYDSSGDLAVTFGDYSRFTPAQQDAAAVAARFSTPAYIVAAAKLGYLSAVVGTTFQGFAATFGGSTTITNQWLKDDVPIVGATTTVYVPLAGDVGGVLKLKTTGGDGVNPSAVSVSGPSDPVVAIGVLSAPGFASQPTISSTTPKVGDFLAVDAGMHRGNLRPTLTYQWLRNGVVLAGATIAVYPVVIGDLGTRISCTVTLTNASGVVSMTSIESSPVLPA